MRKILAGAASAGALMLATAAAPAVAAPNEAACANGTHGTMVAHETVPHHATQAHSSIPHFCH